MYNTIMEPEINQNQSPEAAHDDIITEMLAKALKVDKSRIKTRRIWSKEQEAYAKAHFEKEKVIRKEKVKQAKEKSALVDKEVFTKRIKRRLEAGILNLEDYEAGDDFEPICDHIRAILNNLDKFIELYRGKSIAMAGDKIVVSEIDSSDALDIISKLVPKTKSFGFNFF